MEDIERIKAVVSDIASEVARLAYMASSTGDQKPPNSFPTDTEQIKELDINVKSGMESLSDALWGVNNAIRNKETNITNNLPETCVNVYNNIEAPVLPSPNVYNNIRTPEIYNQVPVPSVNVYNTCETPNIVNNVQPPQVINNIQPAEVKL